MNDTDRLLSELILYVRTSAAVAVRPIANEIIDSIEKAKVYSNLDGKTTQSKIESATGVSQQTISDWIKLFVLKGLAAEPNSYYTNHKALFTSDELGIDINSRKQRKQNARTTTDVQKTARNLVK